MELAGSTKAVVLGAGLAGLTSAYDLSAGYEVKIWTIRPAAAAASGPSLAAMR